MGPSPLPGKKRSTSCFTYSMKRQTLHDNKGKSALLSTLPWLLRAMIKHVKRIVAKEVLLYCLKFNILNKHVRIIIACICWQYMRKILAYQSQDTGIIYKILDFICHILACARKYCTVNTKHDVLDKLIKLLPMQFSYSTQVHSLNKINIPFKREYGRHYRLDLCNIWWSPGGHLHTFLL